MIFVTGPLFAGKRSYARQVLGTARGSGEAPGTRPIARDERDNGPDALDERDAAPVTHGGGSFAVRPIQDVRDLAGAHDIEGFSARVVWDVQDLAAACDEPDLPTLADDLAARYEIVIATEVGAGVVPIDPLERRNRERAGRLACLLAERADAVVRLCCGIPQVLKGELPC